MLNLPRREARASHGSFVRHTVGAPGFSAENEISTVIMLQRQQKLPGWYVNPVNASEHPRPMVVSRGEMAAMTVGDAG
jgi:hypothetical protein